MIVGLSALSNSGKDTVADLLVEHRGFVKVSLADPMKEFCNKLWDWNEQMLWGPSSLRNVRDPRYVGEDGSELSPRKALQLLGTEWGRACDVDVWIRAAMAKARAKLFEGAAGVVISDIRFQNELKAIRKENGEIWRIVRPGAGLVGVGSSHASENDIQESDCDRILLNNRSLAHLTEEIKQMRIDA